MSASITFSRPALARGAVRATRALPRRWRVGLAAACFVGALAAWAARGSAPAPAPVGVEPPPASGRASLHLSSVTMDRSHGGLRAIGLARNVGQATLRNVEAVVELYDARHRLRGVESALLEIATIGAGESSPFRVITDDRPDIAFARVRFRHLLGRAIPTRM